VHLKIPKIGFRIAAMLKEKKGERTLVNRLYNKFDIYMQV